MEGTGAFPPCFLSDISGWSLSLVGAPPPAGRRRRFRFSECRIGATMAPARSAAPGELSDLRGRRAQHPDRDRTEMESDAPGAFDRYREQAICLAPRSPHAQHTKRRRLADLHRRKFPVSKRKQGDFPRITGRRLSKNGQSLRGIRDLDNFSKSK